MTASSEPVGAPRRRVLQVAAAAAVGLGAAACGRTSPLKAHLESVTRVASQDVGLLGRLLDLEYATIAAYEAGIPLLDEDTQKTAEQFLRHELAHAGELAGLIKQAKAKPAEPGLRYPLGHPRTAGEVVDLLHRLEREQLTAYLWAIPRLSEGPVRAAAAAMFANDAQHVALLRKRLGQPPAPDALVSGRE